MTNCLCGGELKSRFYRDNQEDIMREDYCEKCKKVNDRRFIYGLEHDCEKDNPDCSFYFEGKCGGHPSYPPEYDYPIKSFKCVLDLPKKEKPLSTRDIK